MGGGLDQYSVKIETVDVVVRLFAAGACSILRGV